MTVLYTVLLVASLLLNGMVVAGATPLRELFAPLRDRRLLAGALVVDVVLTPAVILAAAALVGPLPDEVRAGLVIVAATSTGPIGIALTRIVGGDQPLAVSVVTAFNALNLITVPILTALLLPAAVPLPLLPVAGTLLGLVVLPLVLGRAWGALPSVRRRGQEEQARRSRRIGRVSSVLLVAALAVALSFELPRVVQLVRGPLGLVVLVSLVMTSAAAWLVGRTTTERTTLAITLNARGAGLALTVVALHFAALPDLRATILVHSGITQSLPVLVALIAKRSRREQSASASVA